MYRSVWPSPNPQLQKDFHSVSSASVDYTELDSALVFQLYFYQCRITVKCQLEEHRNTALPPGDIFKISDAANTHMSSPAWIQWLSCSIELLNYFLVHISGFETAVINRPEISTESWNIYLHCLHTAESLEVYGKLLSFVTPKKEVDTSKFNGWMKFL